MVRFLGYMLGNLLAAWLLANRLNPYLHYPPEVPLRLQPLLPALAAAAAFSLCSLPTVALKPLVRLPLLLLGTLIAVAIAGAFCLPGDPLGGAGLCLKIAAHSPGAWAAAAAWAVAWNLLVFRTRKPLPPRPAPVVREELPISDQWSGSER
mgnify:CR=1 FL=1